jgi:hypothetical protein
VLPLQHEYGFKEEQQRNDFPTLKVSCRAAPRYDGSPRNLLRDHENKEEISTMRKLLLPRATEDTHMADLPPYPGTPRWVKVFGIIALVVVLLFVILMFTRGPGGHGPGRHTGRTGGPTPLMGGHTQP